MSNIQSPFSVDDRGEFRFTLVLEANSLEANSLMFDNREELRSYIDRLTNSSGLKEDLNSKIQVWKDKNK